MPIDNFLGLAADPPSPPAPAFEDEVARAAARLALDQAAVNEALVQKVFQCERAEAALRDSERTLKALLAHQLNHREDERKWLARTIHDSLGQNLLALRLDVAALHQQTAERQPRLHGWVGAALDNLDVTIRSVRQLISDLRPFELELGLQAAVEWEVNKFRRSSGIACRVNGSASIAHLALHDPRLLAVYRMLQACLENVARHSSATEARVTLALAGRTLTLAVADNGVGLRFSRLPSTAFGLLGMREHVHAAGGQVAFAPVLPHGTVVTLTLELFDQEINRDTDGARLE